MMTDFTGGSGDDIFIGTEDSDTARGGGGSDTLIGNGGNDILAGDAGADTLDGGAGEDTAVFSGNVSDYLAVLNADTGVVTITDLRLGSPDGTDTLANLERFQFADGIFVLEALLSGYANGGWPHYAGTVAADIFHGSESSNFVLGFDGDDILFSHGGDDFILGEDGADYLNGGAGADYLYSNVSITEDESVYFLNYDTLGRWVTYSLDVGREVDTLNGGEGDDEIHAGYGDNIDGGAGIDALFIRFSGASSGVTVDFRSNNNVVGGGIITNIEFVASVVGSDFDDDITLGVNAPPSPSYLSREFDAGGFIFGMGGNDRLVAGYFTDSLFGDDGNDVVDGSGSHTLRRVDGGEGDDRLMIAALANTTDVIGGAGFDTFAISGAVSVGGVLDGVEALDLIEGAALTLTGSQFATGLATNTAISGTGTITVNMNSGGIFSAAGMSFAGTGVAMVVNGTSGVDVIKLGLGNSAGNTVNGGDGVDQIRGSQMVDAINGDGGNDKIMGLGGADVLTGGAGNDQFRYYSAADSGLGANADRITDFVIAGDRINFALIDADAATAGDQAFAFIGTGAFATTGIGQVRYTNSGADLVVQADVNGDGIADMEIILQGLNGQMLTGADFIL
jgi:Ca2+-binding RTX toxin-like protein